MQKIYVVLVSVLTIATSSPAFAKGCIRGAVAGGVAGHYVGKGHAVLGATAGCLATRHYYAKQAAAKRAAQKAQARRQ